MKYLLIVTVLLTGCGTVPQPSELVGPPVSLQGTVVESSGSNLNVTAVLTLSQTGSFVYTATWNELDRWGQRQCTSYGTFFDNNSGSLAGTVTFTFLQDGCNTSPALTSFTSNYTLTAVPGATNQPVGFTPYTLQINLPLDNQQNEQYNVPLTGINMTQVL